MKAGRALGVLSRRMPRALRWIQIGMAIGFSALAYIYLTLPDVRPLVTSNPATTAFIELRAAEAHREGRIPRRDQRWVGYGRISGNLKRAVLVAEDDAFWQHEGVDLDQIKESIERDLERGRMVRGGSTITQQLAKNLFLSPSRNPVRKLRELIIARRLEAELTKRRILEIYLNVVEWGDGIYGAEAAARAYFKKPASQLGPSEAALLAGALVNPRTMMPGRPSPRLLRRQRLILARLGSVTPPPATPASPSNAASTDAGDHPDAVPSTPTSEPAADAPSPVQSPPSSENR